MDIDFFFDKERKISATKTDRSYQFNDNPVERKGGRKTGNLSATLAEELESKTAFTIPVFGGVPIAESVVVTWVIMAVLLVLSLILVRNLKVENPGKKQLLLESGVSFLLNFFEGILGEEGKRYIPYLMSTVIYIGIANIAGVFGFTPPTKDMNVTIALRS